ncbi:MAG TPA: RNA 2',3'-cyclic phosphodiesterase [Ectothiorhodospiraceae bacterium]|nr:RNA 2',3'-cyclic phosphodiesterase [Ectothiorhodospiraceae bacterium]
MGNEHHESTDPSEGAPKKRRLFFALWPDNNVRKQIAEINRQLPPVARGSRLMSRSNLHLTLHYIGPVNEVDVSCLSNAAKKVKSASFKLELDRLGYFKRPKVLWLGGEESPDGYKELLIRLSDEIAHCGFEMKEENNTPHVTLRRKVSKPKEFANIQTVEWAVERFVLVESVSIKGGVSYQLVEIYPLNGVD